MGSVFVTRSSTEWTVAVRSEIVQEAANVVDMGAVFVTYVNATLDTSDLIVAVFSLQSKTG